MTSADYAYQAVKGIKEVFNNTMGDNILTLMENRIIDFYVTSESSEIFTSTEGLTGIESLGDEETPPSLALEDGYSATFSPTRYGGAIVVPETVYTVDQPDSTIQVDKFLKEQMDNLLIATQDELLNSAFYILNNAFNSSALTLAPDSVELCGTHTWATGNTFTNSATAALDADAVDDMEEVAGAMKDPTDTDRPWVHNFDTIIVKTGSAAARMAKKLFAFGISPISVADINIYQGEKTVIETPYITSTNKASWFARDSKIRNSVMLGINKTPTLNDPIIEDNQSIRTNCTAFWKRGVRNMPHDWYGSSGTT